MPHHPILNYVGPPTLTNGEESANHHHHRHALEHRHPKHSHRRPGEAVARMITGWADYAAAIRADYEASVGDDGIIGDNWAAIGLALVALLDGDIGGFDGGSLCANIRDLLDQEGYPQP